MDFSTSSQIDSTNQNVSDSQPTNLTSIDADEIPLSQLSNPTYTCPDDNKPITQKNVLIPPPPPPPSLPVCSSVAPSTSSLSTKSCVSLDTESLAARKKSLRHVQWKDDTIENNTNTFVGPVNQTDDDDIGGFIGPLFSDPDPSNTFESDNTMIGPVNINGASTDVGNQSSSNMDLAPVTFVAQGTYFFMHAM